MLHFYRLYWRTARDIGLLAVTIVLLMAIFGVLVNIATPILLALLFFIIIEPLARAIHRMRIKKTIASAIAIGMFVIGIFTVIGGAGAVAAVQFFALQKKINEHSIVIQKHIMRTISNVQTRVAALPPEAITHIEDGLKAASSLATKLASQLLSGLINALSSLSAWIVNSVLALILTYFLSIELPHWRTMAQRHTPQTIKTAIAFLRTHVWRGIVSYMRAQTILIACTFALVFIALLVLGVRNALSIALLAALFDVLPLLGVSTVFVPWIVYCLIVGDVGMAGALAVVLVVVILFRQIMEPRITGDSLGVSAFTVLAAMIVSLSVFGVAGLLLAPVLILLLKALFTEGYMQRWIHIPKEEYAVREADTNP
ncbi:MAG: AI-2E family transporter [Paenibacillaceae bacterium]|jgi:sporulation integral membrane protein YtvI|nr:AI-2E family transporter [Paenibacillaceae bacterium]